VPSEPDFTIPIDSDFTIPTVPTECSKDSGPRNISDLGYELIKEPTFTGILEKYKDDFVSIQSKEWLITIVIDFESIYSEDSAGAWVFYQDFTCYWVVFENILTDPLETCSEGAGLSISFIDEKTVEIDGNKFV